MTDQQAIQILFDAGFRCTNRFEHPDAIDINPWGCPYCRVLAHNTLKSVKKVLTRAT